MRKESSKEVKKIPGRDAALFSQPLFPYQIYTASLPHINASNPRYILFSQPFTKWKAIAREIGLGRIIMASQEVFVFRITKWDCLTAFITELNIFR